MQIKEISSNSQASTISKWSVSDLVIRDKSIR